MVGVFAIQDSTMLQLQRNVSSPTETDMTKDLGAPHWPELSTMALADTGSISLLVAAALDHVAVQDLGVASVGLSVALLCCSRAVGQTDLRNLMNDHQHMIIVLLPDATNVALRPRDKHRIRRL